MVYAWGMINTYIYIRRYMQLPVTLIDYILAKSESRTDRNDLQSLSDSTTILIKQTKFQGSVPLHSLL